MRFYILLSLTTILFTHCHGQDKRDKKVPIIEHVTFEIEKSDPIQDIRLIEVSGIEYSVKNPGMFWVHNDSGDQPRIFLINKNGEIMMEVQLEGVQNEDWEEITLVDRENEEPYLLIGEFGDNQAVRDTVSIIKVMEPKFNGQDALKISRDQVSEMKFTYDNGPRDAEAFFYDYNTEKLVLISKREQDVHIYTFPFIDDQYQVVESQGTIPFRNFNAADMNKEGEILLKNYNTVFYWEKSKKPAFERILAGPKYRIPYEVEPQGEAICWNPEGNFYTISEKNDGYDQVLYRYERKK